ncbi:hypothetical protein [Aeromicrobium chenweiae]|uniref:Uncharacterized protein n=1 Tax=Aeromicrobium chenweiae TaxID=2079793 RepID=A0A2S0WIG8_9ACTN|nr:hypothetical protein [Aeromicrobium chenweiae]AWB91082.1 hypothetical protein C3E78_01955 [Aeromicrobium chenweiae]TGN31985.1 hypothetical protein E4L97_11465 [Aeromicrobium chenweiae]
MKWLLIALVVLLLGGALWVRTARQGAGAAANRPHRLDDSMSTRVTDEPSAPDDPNSAGPQGADTAGTDRT